MSRNGSGTYTLPAGNPVVTGTTISSTTHNNTMSDIESALTASLTKNGEAVATGAQDLNGNELILDADGDTTITADTDDQIDIKIAGADDFKFTANTFEALAGSSLKANTIAETTAGTGVTVDGVLLKDGICAGSGLVLLAAATELSSASQWVHALSGSYNQYVIKLMNLVPQTDGVDLLIRLSDDNGSTYEADAGDYDWNVAYMTSIIADQQAGATTEIYIMGTTANLSNVIGEGGLNAEIYVNRPHNTSEPTTLHWTGSYYDAAGTYNWPFFGAGRTTWTADATHIRITASSGNLETGMIAIYGVKTS